ncbi:hypothetical protein [Streptomyces erythrochromogenes]|uniref:hypothetical protein n=1 Tax=Streptomyces erythrochromogenes TaxID=285574 RepID=UPI0002D898A7
MTAVPGSSDLRRTARLETVDYLATLNLPGLGQSLLPWTRALTSTETAAQFHVVTDAVIGSESGALLGLRDFLRAAGEWCDGHGRRALGDRYRRTSELLDVADRLLFQLGVDQLAAAHPGPTPA